MSLRSPRVSVVMSVYNSELYLRQAVDSVLNQTYTDFEFIIINDASTDSCETILLEYRDERIRYTANKQNIGMARSLNCGLEMAQGEYIARTDNDDVCLPGRFTAQVSFLDKHREVGVLGTAARLIDREGKAFGEVRYPGEHGYLRWILCFFENPIIHPSVMMRRKLISAFGGYDEKKEPSEDYNLWCRLANVTRLANLPDPYLHIRKHGSNASVIRMKEQQQKTLENSRMLLMDILKEDIYVENLHGPCRASRAPNEASEKDFVQLSELVSKVGKATLEDDTLTGVEKHLISQDAIIRFEKILSQVQHKSSQKEILKQFEEFKQALNNYSLPISLQENTMKSFLSLHCTQHKIPLFLNEDNHQYQCVKGCVYPIINNIPRFVSVDNYSQSFGLQWNRFRKTQIDSSTELPISRNRLTRCLGGSLELVRGKLVLEAGCGVGRFTEILLEAGANVFACDLSSVVDANYQNIGRRPGYFICQADILNIPLLPAQFEIVICLGVIQHTPNPETTIAALCFQVKPGGLLVFDHNTYGYPVASSRQRLRSFLLKRSWVFSLQFVNVMIKMLRPLHWLVWKLGNFRWAANMRTKFLKISPVVGYHASYPLITPDLLYLWAMLDRHKTLTDVFKHIRSAEEIAKTLIDCGMVNIETTYAGNVVEVRAHKPL